MHEIQTLSNDTLLKTTDSLAREERRITLELIGHLREIERRMLHAELGYGSLHEFCVRRLGLSEGSAQRRISAMRLTRELPEAKTAILEGDLSLTNAAKLQVAFQAQRRVARQTGEATLAVEEKREALRQILGLSQKECEAKLCEVLPQAVEEMNRERVRRVGTDANEIRLVVSDAFLEQLERVREIFSHSIPNGDVIALFERLMGEAISRFEKKKGLSSTGPSKANDGAKTSENAAGAAGIASLGAAFASTASSGNASLDTASARTASPGTAPVQNETKRSVTGRLPIPAPLQRQVWRRARGRCEYPECTSRFRLEIDHIHPVSSGGTNALDNLRLLCRTHNLAEARTRIGEAKMRPFVSMLRSG